VRRSTPEWQAAPRASNAQRQTALMAWRRDQTSCDQANLAPKVARQ
jgi:hypothetical protein